MSNKPQILKALRSLRAAFYANSDAKYAKWEDGASWVRGPHLYGLKVDNINKAIKNIRTNQLPIKYGYGSDERGDKVIYFEYLGNQVSFHDPFDQLVVVKSYSGNWVGHEQHSCPFDLIIDCLDREVSSCLGLVGVLKGSRVRHLRRRKVRV